MLDLVSFPCYNYLFGTLEVRYYFYSRQFCLNITNIFRLHFRAITQQLNKISKFNK